MRKEPLKVLMEKRIARRKASDVFLRADFADLGDYDQIGRGLLYLVREGALLKIGQGLYARATISPFDDQPIPVKGVSALVTEALNRVGVEAKSTQGQRDYNSGRSTQVPTGRVVGVNKRVRRKIGYGGWTAKFERA